MQLYHPSTTVTRAPRGALKRLQFSLLWMDALDGVLCIPFRRSVKFSPGIHSRHFLVFGTATSKEERLRLMMSVFVYQRELVDAKVTPHFSLPEYLPERYVEVRVVTDPRHPAFGQAGLYAKRNIPANTIVTPYSGFIEIFGTSCNSRTYTMGFGSLSDDYALDAEFAGNYGRFANDPRGVEGLQANLSAEMRYNALGEAFTALVSKRQILAGEEILMSYGKAHSLGSTPWVNVRGEALQRHRYGGVVPFPQLKAPAEKGGMGNDASDLPPAGSCNNTPGGALSHDALWECPQCGMWSHCSTAKQCIDYCYYCHSPRLHGARIVALLSCPPVTKEILVQEGGPLLPAEADILDDGSKRACGSSSPPEETNMDFWAPSSTASSLSKPQPMTSMLYPNCNQVQTRGRPRTKEGEGRVPPASPTSPTSPILSMQYASAGVSWPMNVPFLPWQIWDPAVPSASLARHSKFEAHEHIFLYSVKTSEEEESLANAWSEESSHATSTGRRAKSGRDSADTSHQKKRGMWEKHTNVEVGPPQERMLAACSPGASEETGFQDEGLGVASSYSERDGPSAVHVHPSQWQVKGWSGFVDRFIGLRPLGPTQLESSPIEYARQSLQRMKRRIFSGKAYDTGEVVAYVGGVINSIEDTRCREEYSPLMIPMKYLIPSSWRSRVCRQLREADEKPDDVSSVAVAQYMEARGAADLILAMGSLQLTVTNEMMYCPCLAALDDEDGEIQLSSEVERARRAKGKADIERILQAANITLVLSCDSLGSPHVAAVAVRPIAAFEPLLARVQ